MSDSIIEDDGMFTYTEKDTALGGIPTLRIHTPELWVVLTVFTAMSAGAINTLSDALSEIGDIIDDCADKGLERPQLLARFDEAEDE